MKERDKNFRRFASSYRKRKKDRENSGRKWILRKRARADRGYGSPRQRGDMVGIQTRIQVLQNGDRMEVVYHGRPPVQKRGHHRGNNASDGRIMARHTAARYRERVKARHETRAATFGLLLTPRGVAGGDTSHRTKPIKRYRFRYKTASRGAQSKGDNIRGGCEILPGQRLRGPGRGHNGHRHGVEDTKRKNRGRADSLERHRPGNTQNNI